MVVMTHPWYTPPASFSVPQKWKLLAEDRAHVHNQTWAMVLQGNAEIEDYLDCFQEELKLAGVSKRKAKAFFESVITQRRAQQAAFGVVPQSALSLAFAELESIEVVARENFTCCGTCADAEIGDERDESQSWRGFVYYHQQDAEQIPEVRQTDIGYGAFLGEFVAKDKWEALDDSQKQDTYTEIVSALVKNEVVPILEKHGIGVQWDGDIGTRIRLLNVDSFIAV